MTGLNSNIEALIEKFQLVKENVKNVDFSEALLVGVNAARGSMSFRIFNKGMDSQGVSLGPYKGKKKKVSTKKLKKKAFVAGDNVEFSPYQLKRMKAGRQVRYKDLEFLGDLRRGILSVKESNTRVLCVIVNERLAKIADYQEEQIGQITGKGKVKIFFLSDSEIELLRTNTSAALNQIYVRLFDTNKPV